MTFSNIEFSIIHIFTTKKQHNLCIEIKDLSLIIFYIFI